MPPSTVKLVPGAIDTAAADGIIYVSVDPLGANAPEPLKSAIKTAAALDKAFSSNICILPLTVPAKRLIFSPIKKLTDYDDVRSFSEAAVAGVKRALSAGVKAPLLVLPGNSDFANADIVTLLGALEALYVPIQIREDVPSRKSKAATLLVASESGADVSSILKLAEILEEGRVIARDIGGGDPERMPPPRIQEYVQDIFKDGSISLEVIDKEEIIEKDYPLFAAVNRAASVIERHRGRVIYLRYQPKDEVKKTLFLVGKGITYDTGGADIKISGKMIGMSRDKCGAAAVAGFMKVVARLQPKGLRVVGAMCLARNSVGENAYVSDEVVTARCGARVRVSNTDAEGRMVMGDVLCKLKEEAIGIDNAQLFTIATLTGHAVLTAGPYTVAVDNSVARGTGIQLQARGKELGDPFEVSTLRREDFTKHAGQWEGDDAQQSGHGPSTSSQRGHQGAAAFLNLASGLDKHGLKSAKPLKYTHLDIAGSAGDPPGECSGAPILALYGTYLQDLK